MLDTKLREYATDRQWVYLEAVEKYGSANKAAKALGVAHQTISKAGRSVRRNAAKAGYSSVISNIWTQIERDNPKIFKFIQDNLSS